MSNVHNRGMKDHDRTAPGSNPEQLSEEELVDAAIRAGEKAAEDDLKAAREVEYNESKRLLDELDKATAALEAAEEKAKQSADRFARLQADWENFRRRTALERLAEKERAAEQIIGKLLSVLDDMERAIDHGSSSNDEAVINVIDGLRAIHKKMIDVFSAEGLQAIDPAGEAFDPLCQQAVGRVEDTSVFDETVHDVYQRGYKLANKIIRPAMVTVTYGGAKRPEQDPDESAQNRAQTGAKANETGA